MSDRPHHPETEASPPARILHVSADFPDAVVPNKTKAIQTLLELTQGCFDHSVVSINRRSPPVRGMLKGLLPGPARVEFTRFAWGECLSYEAPARGLFHRTHLLRLADTIAERMRAVPLPDLIVGHKLTVEGIVVQRLSQLTGVPFAITVQGDTDTKILAARPDLAPVFRSIFHEAQSVTLFAPWTLDVLEARLGKRTGPVALIPCPTELDTALAPQVGGSGLISVFHLQSHKRKNLAAMAEALQVLAKRGAPQRLAICGGGSEADLAGARQSAGDAPGLSFEGPLTRESVAQRMNAAAAFVLPSRRETFGMVFVEALFAGVPIIYPQGMGVSGWFDGCPFAIPVPARDPDALADAMAKAVSEEARLKAALAAWQTSPEADRFRRGGIARAYAATLAAACGRQAGSNLEGNAG